MQKSDIIELTRRIERNWGVFTPGEEKFLRSILVFFYKNGYLSAKQLKYLEAYIERTEL